MLKNFHLLLKSTFIALFLMQGNALMAQSLSSISGLVRAKNGDGLPAATVVVRNESTGFQTLRLPTMTVVL